MWIHSEHNPDGRIKNTHTNDEWVDFSNGTAQVRAGIGEQLIEEYDHITEHTNETDT